MALATLALSGAVYLVAGIVFALVGFRFVPRRVSAESQLANQSFAVYWIGMGAYTALGGILDIVAAMGFTPFSLFFTARLVGLPILMMSVGGVTFYFLYLFTGDQRWVFPLAAFFSLTLVAMTYYIADRQPVGVLVTAWRTDLAYANPYETTALSLLALAVALPPIVGAIAYLVLARQLAPEQGSRRIALVGGAILVWSVAAVVARLSPESDFAQLLTRPVLGLVAAMTILYAYRPTGVRDRAASAVDGLLDRARQLI